jgi:hypothetical protein
MVEEIINIRKTILIYATYFIFIICLIIIIIFSYIISNMGQISNNILFPARKVHGYSITDLKEIYDI